MRITDEIMAGGNPLVSLLVMQDVSAEQFPRDHTDVDLGDPPVILPHVVLTFECHARSAPLNKNQTIRYLPTGRSFRRGADFSLAFLPKTAIY